MYGREYNSTTATKDDKECFYKHVNNKMKAKENLHPLLNGGTQGQKIDVSVLTRFCVDIAVS